MQKDILNYHRGLLSWSDLELIAFVGGWQLHNQDGVISATR